MEVIYNNKTIKNNEFLKVNKTQVKPEIVLNVDSSKTYLLIMYDPDAFGGTRIHWVVTNINNNDVNNGYNLLKYKGPAPPPKTGKHRYIFELYEQPFNKTGIVEERSISIKNLRNKLNLGSPIYKIQFISQNERTNNDCRKTYKMYKKKNKKSRKMTRKN